MALGLCDRGVLDSLAYWPSSPEEFFIELGTTREKELARYAAAGADGAGAKATIFNTITVSDAISMGTEGKKYSLV